MKNYSSVDEYIATFPNDVQVLLKQMRQTINQAAPEAKEKIAYGIPTFTLHGNLVHFGGFKDHVSFFPGGVVELFKDNLKSYKTAKGTIQFPLDKPLPLNLIRKIVTFRVAQNSARKK